MRVSLACRLLSVLLQAFRPIRASAQLYSRGVTFRRCAQQKNSVQRPKGEDDCPTGSGIKLPDASAFFPPLSVLQDCALS